MSLNSSNSSLDAARHHDDTSQCYTTFTVLNASRLLVLPLYVFVVVLAWRRRRRSSASGSQSDVFTLHLAAMELTSTLGLALYYGGHAAGRFRLRVAGRYLSTVIFYGQIFFHVLTCAESYLAVVRPVAYRGLRNGVRVRNVGAGGVWALSFLSTCATLMDDPLLPVLSQIAVLSCSLAVACFCGVSVLWVLVGPRPGEGGGARERADGSKRRAFLLIAAIVGALVLSVAGLLVPAVLLRWWAAPIALRCVVQICGMFFNLPSEMLAPLRFLRRAGGPLACRRTPR